MSTGRRLALLVACVVVAALIIARSCRDAATDAPTPSTVDERPAVGTVGRAPQPTPTHSPRRRDRPDDAAAPTTVATDTTSATAQTPADGATGATIEVVNEDGVAVAGAVLRVWIADASVEKHAGFPWIRESIRAWNGPEHAAPVVLSGAPKEADGLRLVAFGTAPGSPPLPRVEFAVHAGRMETIRLVATKGRTADIVVVDSTTDKPVAGARVTSETEHDRRRAVDVDDPPPARTDAQGRCALGGLGPGEHHLEIHADRHQRGEATWTSGELRIRLKPFDGFCSVGVTVLGPDGARVPNVVVTLVGTDREQKTDEAGKTVFKDVESGFVMVSIDEPVPDEDEPDPPEGFRGEAESDVADGGTCELVLGVIPAGTGSIEARLVDENGAPIARVPVRVFDVGNHEAKAVTDEAGNARFAPLPRGKYQATMDVGQDASWYIDEFEGAALDEGAHARATWTLGALTVKGRVVAGADRHGVKGLTVWFRGAATGAAHTDAAGRFELPRVRAGEYLVETGTGDSAGSRRVKLPMDGDVVVELIEFGRVVLRFAKDDRERLRGADAWLYAGDELLSQFKPGAGDDDLVCSGVVPKKYEVEVTVGETRRRFPVDVKSRETSVVEVKWP